MSVAVVHRIGSGDRRSGVGEGGGIPLAPLAPLAPLLTFAAWKSRGIKSKGAKGAKGARGRRVSSMAVIDVNLEHAEEVAASGQRPELGPKADSPPRV